MVVPIRLAKSTRRAELAGAVAGVSAEWSAGAVRDMFVVVLGWSAPGRGVSYSSFRLPGWGARPSPGPHCARKVAGPIWRTGPLKIRGFMFIPHKRSGNPPCGPLGAGLVPGRRERNGRAGAPSTDRSTSARLPHRRQARGLSGCPGSAVLRSSQGLLEYGKNGHRTVMAFSSLAMSYVKIL